MYVVGILLEDGILVFQSKKHASGGPRSSLYIHAYILKQKNSVKIYFSRNKSEKLINFKDTKQKRYFFR